MKLEDAARVHRLRRSLRVTVTDLGKTADYDSQRRERIRAELNAAIEDADLAALLAFIEEHDQ